MSWLFRTAEDDVIADLRRVNRIRLGNVKKDRTRAPHTVIFSLKFLLPETDAKRVSGLSGHSFIAYPKPIKGLKEKKIFQPIRTDDGIVVRVFWYAYLGENAQVEARRDVAKFLNRIYLLTRDRKRPVVSLRAHLVDWNVGFALEKSVLLDPWYSERTFGGIKLDTFNLKSWGMAESAPILNKDRSALRGAHRDTWTERYDRKNPNTREVVDPITENMQIDPVALVRREVASFIVAAEKKLPQMLIESKGVKPNIAGLRAKQIISILRTSYFETSARQQLFQIYLNKYNNRERGARTSDRRSLVADLRVWLWDTLKRRFL